VTGGAQVLEQVAVREYLPPETAKLFEQDARHQVLWFSGPPLPQGAVQIPAPPNHSLEYLAFLSKRKRGESKAAARPPNAKRFKADGGTEKSEDGDAEGEEEEEDLSAEWWTQGMTPEQVLASLKAVVNGAA
jgi:chromatin structure-remodeling complex subunit RSC1/2